MNIILKASTWVLRLLAAGILLSTLYFKFTGQPESVALFTALGVEPWGRIGTGLIELIAGILLLIRPTVIWGSLLGAGLMAGAIGSHLLVLGIESARDGGQLFAMAWVVLIACLILLYLFRKDALEVAILPTFIKQMIR